MGRKPVIRTPAQEIAYKAYLKVKNKLLVDCKIAEQHGAQAKQDFHDSQSNQIAQLELEVLFPHTGLTTKGPHEIVVFRRSVLWQPEAFLTTELQRALEDTTAIASQPAAPSPIIEPILRLLPANNATASAAELYTASSALPATYGSAIIASATAAAAEPATLVRPPSQPALAATPTLDTSVNISTRNLPANATLSIQPATTLSAGHTIWAATEDSASAEHAQHQQHVTAPLVYNTARLPPSSHLRRQSYLPNSNGYHLASAASEDSNDGLSLLPWIDEDNDGSIPDIHEDGSPTSHHIDDFDDNSIAGSPSKSPPDANAQSAQDAPPAPTSAQIPIQQLHHQRSYNQQIHHYSSASQAAPQHHTSQPGNVEIVRDHAYQTEQ